MTCPRSLQVLILMKLKRADKDEWENFELNVMCSDDFQMFEKVLFKECQFIGNAAITYEDEQGDMLRINSRNHRKIMQVTHHRCFSLSQAHHASSI